MSGKTEIKVTGKVETVRRGGRYEFTGTVLIIAAIVLGFVFGSIGVLFWVGLLGLIIFLAGRFM